MATGDAELDAMLLALRRLGELPTATAARAAPLVLEAVQKTAAAGTTPDGQAWKPRKDGGRALANAAGALSASSSGPTVTISLDMPEVIHHYGSAKVPRRQILPDAGAGMPASVTAALKKAATQAFDAAVGGG